MTARQHQPFERDDAAYQRQKEHPVVTSRSFPTIESYVLHLVQGKAYEEAAQIAAGKSVLDWGCNDGWGMERMRRHVGQIAGLDLAEHLVLAARQRMPDLESNIRLYDGNRPPFRPGTFDVVTSFQVIEHVGDYRRYLSHILEVLKPGGIAIFTTPNRTHRLDPGDKPWNPFHVREFTPSELKDLLDPWFSSVEIRGLHAVPEMEAIERRRCQASKNSNKRILPPYWKVRTAVITQIKAVLPASLVIRLRQLLAPPEDRDETSAQALGQDELNRFSLRDCWYTKTDLDKALDLMAVSVK